MRIAAIVTNPTELTEDANKQWSTVLSTKDGVDDAETLIEMPDAPATHNEQPKKKPDFLIILLVMDPSQITRAESDDA